MGDCEHSLLLFLQTDKCPHGRITTEALDWKHFLHKLICLSSCNSCIVLLCGGMLDDIPVSVEVDRRSLCCDSGVDVKMGLLVS